MKTGCQLFAIGERVDPSDDPFFGLEGLREDI